MLKLSKKKFNPEQFPEGVWAQYSEGVRFKIRKITGSAIKELRRPYVRFEMELSPSSRRMEQIEKVDTDKFDDALAMYMIEAFEGVGDEDGNMLSDDLESRKIILDIPVLKDFIWAVSQSIDIAGAVKQEAVLQAPIGVSGNPLLVRRRRSLDSGGQLWSS